MSTENNNALRLRKQPSPGFTSFKNWIKGAILRNQKEKQPMLTAPQSPPTEGTLRRLPSSPKRVPSKRSTSTTKRRRSQRYSHQPSPHRSRKLFSVNSVSNSNSTSNSTSNSNSDSNSNSNSKSNSISKSNKKNKKKNNNNKNKNKKLIITDNNNDSSDDDIDSNNCSDTDSWADEEISNKNELIIPNINPPLLTSVDKPETSTSTTISNTFFDQDLQQSKSFSDTSSDDSRDDFLENTRIVKGSVEHFAYVRTLRKLRGKDKKRSLLQVLLLNNILDSLSFSQLSDEIREALNHYKNRVYELNRLKRTSIIISNNDILSRSTFNDSTSSLCPSSMVNKRLSVILSGVHPTSPISMKYRASYASTKVVMVFDEESNQLVVKDLPMARRRRRLSDLSVLGRSTTSSTTSTNSSQSSLVTLTDDVEQNKYSPITTKEPDSYLSNLVVIQNDDGNDGEDDEEDNVPLFVLKEQFRYSGRSYTYLRNNVSSVEENGPSRVTLAV